LIASLGEVTLTLKKPYLSLDPLICLGQEQRPVAWSDWFGRAAEVEVEIGFGLGDFLVRRASQHPDRDFVGLEMGWPMVRRTLRKIVLARLTNVRVVQADARMAIEWYFAEQSIRRITALFPCPWPKEKHLRHRLLSNGFLSVLNTRMAEQGEVLVVTDDESYSRWVVMSAYGTGFAVSWQEVPTGYSTKYERKWQLLGQERFYEVRLKKRNHLSISVGEEVPLISRFVTHLDTDSLAPVGCRGALTVEFKEILYDQKREKGMVRCVVKENRLLQNFWIEIVHERERWCIRPAKGCAIIPSRGAQRALDLVHEAALSTSLHRT
jgi:tRNA (guanine-N7-)-methyltransferase